MSHVFRYPVVRPMRNFVDALKGNHHISVQLIFADVSFLSVDVLFLNDPPAPKPDIGSDFPGTDGADTFQTILTAVKFRQVPPELCVSAQVINNEYARFCLRLHNANPAVLQKVERKTGWNGYIVTGLFLV